MINNEIISQEKLDHMSSLDYAPNPTSDPRNKIHVTLSDASLKNSSLNHNSNRIWELIREYQEKKQQKSKLKTFYKFIRYLLCV